MGIVYLAQDPWLDRLLRVPMIIAETILLLTVSTAVGAERGTAAHLPAPGPVRAAQAAPAAADDSVAITVFSNISGAAADDWVGTGIVETLAAGLEGAGGVSVVGHQAVSGAIAQLSAEGRSAEATEETAVAASRLLGARWVISGGYQRLGDRMRITARVVEVATATVVHTAIVDGSVADLFALQDRLAAELRRGLPAGSGAVASSLPASVPRVDERALTGEDPPSAEPSELTAAGRGSDFAAAPVGIIDGPPAPVAPATLTRDAAGRVTVRAVRLTESLRLDGALDEAFYEEVPSVDGFIQQLPVAGAPSTEPTEAWVFYDEQHVYVSARLWDSAPESQWVANEMQRDSSQIVQNDYFSVMLDTYYDRRNGVVFVVNPIGGFFDIQVADEGNPNPDWNAIWDVRTGRFDGGWSVEMEIPFKSLRFRPGVRQMWGMQLGRRIRTELTYLTSVPINARPAEARISAAGTLTGVDVPAATGRSRSSRMRSDRSPPTSTRSRGSRMTATVTSASTSSTG